jgi:hypothetical protein
VFDLSLGWIVLAAGIISALVIATDKTSHTSDVSPQAENFSRHHQDLKPVTRWSLVRWLFCLDLSELC